MTWVRWWKAALKRLTAIYDSLIPGQESCVGRSGALPPACGGLAQLEYWNAGLREWGEESVQRSAFRWQNEKRERVFRFLQSLRMTHVIYKNRATLLLTHLLEAIFCCAFSGRSAVR